MDTIITAEHVREAAAVLRERADIQPGSWGIVLGSGMSNLADAIEDPAFVPYAEVPYMETSTAPGHVGRFVIGHIGGQGVICMQGRLHAYEGYTAQEIAFPIYVMHELGAEHLIVTNASGGINPDYGVGDLMIISDHINLLGMDPCMGPLRPEVSHRFFDMTHAYDPELRKRALKAAEACSVPVHEGVYVAEPGPSFETPAEIRAYRVLGADAVGMSTVLEVIAARSCEMRVLGISMVSNPAAGVKDEALSMDDVFAAAKIAAAEVGKLIIRLLEEAGEGE